MGDLEREIRERLISYIRAESTLEDFKKWFIPRVWDAHSEGRLVEELVDEIQLRLAEFANGDWSEPELKAKLKPLVLSVVTTYGHTVVIQRSSSSEVTQTMVVRRGTSPSVTVDRLYEVASG